MKAKNIRMVNKGVNIAGHAAANNKPESILNAMDDVLFTNEILRTKVRKNYQTIRTFKICHSKNNRKE